MKRDRLDLGFPVAGTVQIIMICVAVAVVALLVFEIFRLMKQKKSGNVIPKGKKAGCAVLSLVMVLSVVGNGLVYKYNYVINQYLSSPKIDEAAWESARANSKMVAQELEDEGIILLENKKGALPFLVRGGENKINLFGYASNQINYGGRGSGGGSDEGNVSLEEGLKQAGFEINGELMEFYQDNFYKAKEDSKLNMKGGDHTIPEPALAAYPDGIMERAKAFSDIAVVTIARTSGEGADLPGNTGEGRHTLELSKNEEELLDAVKSLGFAKVVVIINSGNPLELGFLKDDGIDAALWIGFTGVTGANSVGNVLAGTVNPSGRTTDTYTYKVESNPTYYNFAPSKYIGETAAVIMPPPYGAIERSYAYVNYVEGIYMGYRYFETRWIENETGVCDEEEYQKNVLYPFGYGLSYTDFQQKIVGFKGDTQRIAVDVEVTNTGSVPGKDVVQLYYTAPYTVGGIEKSHVVLAGFAKTSMLEPGASETVSIEWAVEDMASYDYKNEKAYVLDAGTYEIKLMKNAHERMEQKAYEVPETIVYGEGNKRSGDMVAATNQLGSFDDNLVYVSRADWEGTLPKKRAGDIEAPEGRMEALRDRSVVIDETAEDIVVKDHGLTWLDVKGLDYDDPKWALLLEQIPVNEMVRLVSTAGFGTVPMASIGKISINDIDGPAGMNGLVSNVAGTRFPSEFLAASTWNADLLEKMGDAIARELRAIHYAGLYAPAVNLHRTPFGGRNFEYYSEDGFLSGKMAAAFVKGAKKQDIYCFVKHFALYDQESTRLYSSFSNEQAARELYLKPFEIAVKEGNTQAIMTSYNFIGERWSGNNKELIQNVLRGEWGFEGAIISDADGFDGDDYMNTNQALIAGNNMMLATVPDLSTAEITETNGGRQALRTATHHILYTIVNSAAAEYEAPGCPAWMVGLIAGDAVLVLLFGLGIWKLTGNKRRKNRG